ncbi:hypothetical protein CBM2608_A290004 [Cupriavidus taiwanensis]|nr:hypothetical protein CBM2608_A290004 [Cupriavidus taiwanensis]
MNVPNGRIQDPERYERLTQNRLATT